ncbi:MAG: AraC family transcriptional regulator [Cytophagales bacterium]|nr:AraC family transcriptional regulator [Cytophagales bacterium]
MGAATRKTGEIAYELQFNDSSYFCRFFRKQTGISPQGFRRTNHF